MSDEQQPGGIRRVSSRDRKQKLNPGPIEFGPLTPRAPQSNPSEGVTPEVPVNKPDADPPAEAVDSASDVLPFEFEYPPEWRGARTEIRITSDEPSEPVAADAAPAVSEPPSASEQASEAAAQPEPDIPGLPSDAVQLSDDALLAMLASAESNTLTQETPLDPDTEALLGAIEDDTAALRAITDAEAAAYRARQPVPERFPPLPDEPPLSRRATAREPARPTVSMPRAKPRRRWPYNVGTLLFALGTLGLCYAFTTIWMNPFSALNPRPPLTPVPIVVSQTPTPTLTPVPSATFTLSPTFTPSNTPEPSATPTETPIPGTPTPVYAFTVPTTLGSQQVYITNPEQRGGCRWSSLAGSVSDVNGEALNGFQIRVLGEGVDETLVSGSATGFGPGGFELPLGFEARDAQFAVQLLDPNGTPVSNVYTITTSSRCDWNISVVRFQQQPMP